MPGPGEEVNGNLKPNPDQGQTVKKAPARKLPPQFPAVLMLGLVSQVGQVLLLRELLMVFHGNELSIGLILASWMIWVGVGSRLGAALVERNTRPFYLLMGSAAGILVLLPLSIFAIRALRGFFDIPPGAYLSLVDMTLSCLVIMAPVCLLLGAQFVFLAKIWRESDRAEDTSGAGKTYVGEAAGNMLGGILFTFVFVHYLNAFQTAVLAGLLMIGASGIKLFTAPALKLLSSRMRLVVLALMALVVLVFPFLNDIDQWAYRIQWRYFAPDHELVDTRQSEHGAITVVQHRDQFTFFQSGHLIFSTAGPEAAAPGMEEQEAVEFAHLAMVQHRQPERVLLIGGGLRGVLSEIAKHPVEVIDYIELDEALTETARPFVSRATLEALEDPRVNLIHTDGRLFVKMAEEKYDLIIVDVPDPATAVLNRFYTEEFFSEAEDLLFEDGVLVTGVLSTPDLRGTVIANRNTTIYHTLNRVFARVLPAGERFMFYFATNEPTQVSLDVVTLEERFMERGVETEDFSPGHYRVMLEESQLRRVNWVVRNHGRSSGAHLTGPAAAPVTPAPIEAQEAAEKDLPPVQERYFINTDFRPIGYYYTLMHWDQLTRPDDDRTLWWPLRAAWWWVFPFCLAPLMAVLGLRFKNRGNIRENGSIKTGLKKVGADTNFAVIFTVFTTGFSTMALQIALIFSFQSIYGFVYEIVGLIMALFMGGLALGAYLTNRYIKYKASIKTLALVQLVISVLAVMIALVLPRAAAVESPAVIFTLFSLLTFSAGLINGVDFPISLACYMALNKRAEKTAGIVYGVELFGACLGAILTSAVVAPVFGITAACILAAIANFTAFVVILSCRRGSLWVTDSLGTG